MRVGLFVDHFDPAKGGMERAVAQLVERLVESGHEARVYGLSAASDAPGQHCAVTAASARRGELVIQRGTLSDLIDRLLAEPTTARSGGEFAKLHKTLDRRLRELQSAVLDVRMVPLRQVFERVSRVVRRIRMPIATAAIATARPTIPIQM